MRLQDLLPNTWLGSVDFGNQLLARLDKPRGFVDPEIKRRSIAEARDEVVILKIHEPLAQLRNRNTPGVPGLDGA